MLEFSAFKSRVCVDIKDGRINRQTVATVTILVTMLYIGSVMMFFGVNFWLWSFTPGLKRSYTTILIPSICWNVLTLGTVGIAALYHNLKHGKFENYFFWVNKKGILLLFLIGAFDSLTGLTGMYATVHVSQILQSALISTGPIWSFILSIILYPSSQPKFHPFLIVVVILTAAGVTLAVLPQVLDDSQEKVYFSAPWTFIYLLATVLFPLYNVLQGRFLHEFCNHCSPFTRKMVMLAVETTVQLILTLCYFPVDFSPFLGTCNSAKESWDNLVASVHCIGDCPKNFSYMVIYVLGFWIRHVVFAYLNTYSPSVAAVMSMLTQPINTFLLLSIPSWNVYGSKKDWRFTLGCFLCLLFAMIAFIVWHLAFITPVTSREADDISLPSDERDNPEPQGGCLKDGIPACTEVNIENKREDGK